MFFILFNFLFFHNITMEDFEDQLEVLCLGKYERAGGEWTHEVCTRERVHGPGKLGRYCGNHDKMGRVYEDAQRGVRHCVNTIRACQNIIEPGSEYLQCETCRTDLRGKDKTRRGKRIEHHEKQKAAGLAMVDCGKCKTAQAIELYVSSKGRPTYKCEACLTKDRKREQGRGNRTRDYSKKRSRS